MLIAGQQGNTLRCSRCPHPVQRSPVCRVVLIFGLAASIVLLLSMGLWFLARNGAQPEMPTELRLAGLKPNALQAETRLRLPEGRFFEIVLGLPDDTSVANLSTLSISIAARRAAVFEHIVAPDGMVESNWLQPHGLRGLILTWPRQRSTGNLLDEYLVPGREYDLHVTLTAPLHCEGSLWLVYMRRSSSDRETWLQPTGRLRARHRRAQALQRFLMMATRSRPRVWSRRQSPGAAAHGR